MITIQPPPRCRTICAIGTVVALALSGCATSRTEAPRQSGAQASAQYAPVTVTNCDEQVTFEKPPQRIVSMNDHVTDVLLAMGAGERLVGMGYAKATPLPKYTDQW